MLLRVNNRRVQVEQGQFFLLFSDKKPPLRMWRTLTVTQTRGLGSTGRDWWFPRKQMKPKLLQYVAFGAAIGLSSLKVMWKTVACLVHLNVTGSGCWCLSLRRTSQ